MADSTGLGVGGRIFRGVSRYLPTAIMELVHGLTMNFRGTGSAATTGTSPSLVAEKGVAWRLDNGSLVLMAGTLRVGADLSGPGLILVGARATGAGVITVGPLGVVTFDGDVTTSTQVTFGVHCAVNVLANTTFGTGSVTTFQGLTGSGNDAQLFFGSFCTLDFTGATLIGTKNDNTTTARNGPTTKGPLAVEYDRWTNGGDGNRTFTVAEMKAMDCLYIPPQTVDGNVYTLPDMAAGETVSFDIDAYDVGLNEGLGNIQLTIARADSTPVMVINGTNKSIVVYYGGTIKWRLSATWRVTATAV